MNFSIRQRLVVNLLIAVLIIISLTALGIYYITSRNIEQRIDADLVASTLVFQSAIGNSSEYPNSMKLIQSLLSNIPKKHRTLLEKYKSSVFLQKSYGYSSSFQYQLWDKHGNLLLHSHDAPLVPMSDGKVGFQNTFIDDQAWRVFTYIDNHTKNIYIVAENSSQQQVLKNALAINNIIIILISIPLMSILIWFIVNQSLGRLSAVTNEISQRAPTYLEPVNQEHAPIEVQPLIKAINKLFKQLKQAFEREQRFAADAAHELRTPMAAIKTQTQVAMHAQSKTDLNESLSKILAGVDRSSHVVQQLLTLSRLNPGSSMDQHKSVNLITIIKEIISELVPLAIENDAELEFIYDQENISILGNVSSLGILARNLIDNAIRYTPTNGKVKVEIEDHKKFVIFRVSDNGPGIPEKLRSRVFERFFRVLGTQKPGSGLGLAIVQQISNLHHAELTLGKPKTGTGLVVEIKFSHRI
jgi:two-component system sensor histidine kinase QseC